MRVFVACMRMFYFSDINWAPAGAVLYIATGKTSAHTRAFSKVGFSHRAAFAEQRLCTPTNKVAFVPRFFDRSVQKLVLLASSALAQKAEANSATLQLIGVLIFFVTHPTLYNEMLKAFQGVTLMITSKHLSLAKLHFSIHIMFLQRIFQLPPTELDMFFGFPWPTA